LKKCIKGLHRHGLSVHQLICSLILLEYSSMKPWVLVNENHNVCHLLLSFCFVMISQSRQSPPRIIPVADWSNKGQNKHFGAGRIIYPASVRPSVRTYVRPKVGFRVLTWVCLNRIIWNLEMLFGTTKHRSSSNLSYYAFAFSELWPEREHPCPMDTFVSLLN